MTAIFVATTVAKLDWPWLPYLRAFAEAGMVGACADWFAVVALFRRPLGLPIPHTGIVPNNKERIGGALGRFITNNFLTAPALNERLARVDVVGSRRALARRAGKRQAAGRLSRRSVAAHRRVAAGAAASAKSVGRLAQQALATVPAAPLASKLLAIVWAQGEAQALIAHAIDYGESCLAGNKDYFTQQDRRAIVALDPEMGRQDDRRQGDERRAGDARPRCAIPTIPGASNCTRPCKRLIADLAADPQMHARGEAFKAELLANPLFIEQAKALWTEIESGLQWGIPAHAQAIAQAVRAGAARHRAAGCRRIRSARSRSTAASGRSPQRLLLAYRVEIGGYIERVVRNWDSATLVERLELQVGKDLQFIRINGTLVGGLVGLLIFIASKWIAAL